MSRPWDKSFGLAEGRVKLPFSIYGAWLESERFPFSSVSPPIGKSHRRSLSLDQRTAVPQSTQWPGCSLHVADLFPEKPNGDSDSALDCQLPNSGLCGELLYSDSLEDFLWR